MHQPRLVSLRTVLAAISAFCVLAGALALSGPPAQAALVHPFIKSFGAGLFSSPGILTGLGDVTVDQSTGDVYAIDMGTGSLYKFDASGNPVDFSALGTNVLNGQSGPDATPQVGLGVPLQVAVDSSGGPANGDIYVTNENYPEVVVNIFDSTGTYIGQLTGASEPWGDVCGVAVDPTGNVYVKFWGGSTGVDIFTPTSNPLTDSDYVSSIGEGSFSCQVAVYFNAGAPQLVYVTGIEGGSVAVDPVSNDIYTDNRSLITQSDSSGNLINTFPVSGPGEFGDSSGVAVNGTTGDIYVADGRDGLIDIFGPVTPVAPAIDATGVSSVTSASAVLGGRINPDLADTRYYFQYGTDTSYGKDAPASPGADIGSGSTDQSVSRQLEGLQEGVTYHYRLVATNSLGTSDGPDQTFTTEALNSTYGLPDGRQYEMVSPPDKLGALIAGFGGYSGGGLIQAAADGSKITYLAYSPFANPKGNANGSQILSTVGAGGVWSSQDISTPHASSTGLPLGTGTEYKAFSQDISVGALLQDGGTPLTPFVPGNTRYLYLNDLGAGGYQPLAPYPEALGGFKAGTPDFSHVVFESTEALTPGAVPYPRASVPVGTANLYEWSAGRLQQVNVLPDGKTAPGEMGTGFSNFNDVPEILHAISDDGSRIIWQTAETDSIYERDMENKTTVPIALGDFVTASPDGSKVFTYHSTNGSGDLFEYDVATGVSTDLESGEPSGDGSYISSIPGGLQVLHYSDSQGPGAFVLPSSEKAGGSRPSLGPSRVSPDGRFVVFMSSEKLTGYDNTDGLSGLPDQEVYEYDAATARLTCVSCDPSGGRPVGSSSIPGTTDFEDGAGNYYSRALSPDGRVFFDSSDTLVPHDSNGVQDVYEFEPGGVGSCQVAGGCVSLISSGASGEASTFLDASADGSDVFFLTTDQLVSADTDHSVDVYDAHVCSAGAPCPPVVAVSPPACASSDACKVGPTPQPQTFGPPASATFSGAENPTPTVTAPLAKKAVKQTAKRHKKVKRRPKRPRRSGKGHSTKRSGKSNGKGRK